jgi:hypothetical protein
VTPESQAWWLLVLAVLLMLLMLVPERRLVVFVLRVLVVLPLPRIMLPP